MSRFTFMRRLKLPLSVGGLALALLLGGCMSPLPTDQRLVSDDPLLAGTLVRDKVLWQYRLGLSALRAGRYDEAKARLDDAILTMGGILADRADAQRARSLWAGEERKTFIGEPYERAMAYYYRGLLYWRDGEPDNARACFRSAQFIDSVAVDGEYRADYVLFDYLDGLASEKLAADGSDAFRRAEASARRALPPYDAQADVLIFAEWGRGPVKYAAGDFGERLMFDEPPSSAKRAQLRVDGRTIDLEPWDDLYFQATTRGGRVMDYILGNKAVFKGTADAVGDVAAAGAIIAAERARMRDSEGSQNTALALAAMAVLSKTLSAAANAQADVRTWDNLPRHLSFAALRLPPGEHPASITYLDENGRSLPAHTRRFTISVAPARDARRDTVVFLSQLAKNPVAE